MVFFMKWDRITSLHGIHEYGYWILVSLQWLELSIMSYTIYGGTRQLVLLRLIFCSIYGLRVCMEMPPMFVIYDCDVCNYFNCFIMKTVSLSFSSHWSTLLILVAYSEEKNAKYHCQILWIKLCKTVIDWFWFYFVPLRHFLCYNIQFCAKISI